MACRSGISQCRAGCHPPVPKAKHELRLARVAVPPKPRLRVGVTVASATAGPSPDCCSASVPEHCSERTPRAHFQPFGRSSDAERTMVIHRRDRFRMAERGRRLRPTARFVRLAFGRCSPRTRHLDARSVRRRAPSCPPPGNRSQWSRRIAAGERHTLAPARLPLRHKRWLKPGGRRCGAPDRDRRRYPAVEWKRFCVGSNPCCTTLSTASAARSTRTARSRRSATEKSRRTKSAGCMRPGGRPMPKRTRT
jgi:hypothetical protein